MKKINGPESDGIRVEWRRLHDKELYDLYSTNIIRVKSRRMNWAAHVSLTVGRKGTARILVGKPEGKGPLGRTRCRWEEHIKIYVQELGWDSSWLRKGTGGERL